jgi:hypothetical protein
MKYERTGQQERLETLLEMEHTLKMKGMGPLRQGIRELIKGVVRKSPTFGVIKPQDKGTLVGIGDNGKFLYSK